MAWVIVQYHVLSLVINIDLLLFMSHRRMKLLALLGAGYYWFILINFPYSSGLLRSYRGNHITQCQWNNTEGYGYNWPLMTHNQKQKGSDSCAWSLGCAMLCRLGLISLSIYKLIIKILQSIWKAFTRKMINNSGHNFAHATTAQLSWHVQNHDLIVLWE